MTRKRFLTKKTWLAAAIIALLIFLHFTKIIFPIESGIAYGINTIADNFYSMGSDWRERINTQKDKASLAENLDQAQKQIAELLVEKARWQQVEQENNRLREYLDFFSENNHQKILAKVVARQNLLVAGNSQASLYLDKGSRQGIYEGLGIINEEGILVGKITEVKQNSSLACLTINEDCRVAATVENENQTLGIVNGNLGLTIAMDFIPQNHKLNLDDLVVSSGLEEEIPAGLLIGQVSEVIQHSNEIWQQAILEPLYNTDKLTIVSVIIPQ